MPEPTPFTDLVLGRLADADAGDELGDDAQNLVLAALQGDDELDEAVAALTGAAPRPDRKRPHPNTGTTTTATTGVHLRAITVTAFRGIGPTATLDLAPGPGLTVVAGRNGSGKSSFAEAAELALTGAVGRWADSRAAAGGWRNLHAALPTEVRVDLAVTGVDQPVSVRRRWPGDDYAVVTATSQVRGRPRATVRDLGWDGALSTYRPFLSPTELSALDDKPSVMFDALQAILGLDELTTAQARLRAAARTVDDQAGVAREQLPDLRAALTRTPDPRAAQVDGLLARPARSRDLDSIAALATGTAADPDSNRFAQLTNLDPPRPDVTDLVTTLRSAVADRDALAGTATDDARRVAQLLDAALTHHAAHGDGPCPVCGSGSLDAAWTEGATAERDRCRTLARDLDAADRALSAAELALRARLSPVPAALAAISADVADTPGVPTDAARRAWTAWAGLSGVRDPGLLADGVETTLPGLVDTVAALRDAATHAQATRDTGWREIAELLATWVNAARTERALAPAGKRLKAAQAWLRDAGDQLRDDRLRPFAEQSAAIWAALRQESNVSLAGIRLQGSATRRRLTLDVDVDGAPTAGLGVMSQGEFNALGLALFLPRATASDSPFRFVVLDDPVQAMDPGKVDGLARVLADLAQHRQVVVFSHDDRLPESLRRLQLPATVVEVVRSAGSAISIRPLTDPVAAHLDDARALERTGGLDEDLRSIGVAGCCRDAFEAACLEVLRRTRVGRGIAHEEVDRAWAGTSTTERAALALFDDASRGADVYPRLRRTGPWAADCLRALKEGAHQIRDTAGLVHDTDRLVAEIRR